MGGCRKRLSRVLIGWALGLVLLPWGGLWAQDPQDRQVAEPTPQPAGFPQQEADTATQPLADKAPFLANYIIGAEDVLIIDVFNVPELSKITVRVANDGAISLPLLGQIPAAGLTTEQLRAELESRWGESYLENPQITVFVQDFRGRPVSVIGAVDKPGLYQLPGPRTLIEMLSTAGGLGKRGSAPAGRYVYVTRQGGFGDLDTVEGMHKVAPDKVEIDLRRLIYSHEDALNIQIEPRDIISVSKADVVYVAGNGVARPGGFLLEDRERVTVLQALAMAQGLSPYAAKGAARIIRTEQDGSRKQIRIDLKRIMKGKADDPELAANDILFIPDSAQKQALRRGVETAIATMSGFIIWRM